MNVENLATALKTYSDTMRDYLIGTLKQHYPDDRAWFETYLEALGSRQRENVLTTLQKRKDNGEDVKPEDVFDIIHVKNLLLGQRGLFQEQFGRSFNRVVTWADEIVDVRHEHSHQRDIAPNDLTRALDSMVRILDMIGAEDNAKQLAENMRELAAPVHHVNQTSLQPWWQAAEPHRDIRKGHFDESTFAAQLGQVVSGDAPSEYQRADNFFKKTYLTRELRGLLVDTLKRLADVGGEAVVQLRTPFGGGKTHTLIALYHLIDSAADVEDEDDIQGVLKEAGLEHIPHARVAVMVGTEMDVQPREVEAGVTIHTLWGDVAYQLGGKDGYEQVRAADESRVSPSGASLRTLLAQHKRVLILFDELLVYQVKASAIKVEDSNLQAQTFAFLQTLTEAVSSSRGCAFVTTFPESHIEYYDHDNAEVVFDTLGKILGRIEAARVPVQGEEIFEVVRRRLFEIIDESSTKAVIAAYQDVYEDYADDLPDHVRSSEYGKRMQRAYPFHPEVIDVLYERWGSMQTFQKTRGVLRLLARVIEYSYMSPSARPLISLGDVGLDDPDLRATITGILRGGNWDPVIAADIVPESGRAYLLDKERGDHYAKQRLAQTISTAVFMYSHAGGGERGVQQTRLNLALSHPEGINPTFISDALARLRERLYYLYGSDSQRYVFRVQANLNAVLNERTSQVKPELVSRTLKRALEQKIGRDLFQTIIWPQETRDVADNTTLKLVLLPLSVSAQDTDALHRQGYLIHNQAAGPRINKNTVIVMAAKPEDVARAKAVARELLALEDISEDRGLELSEDQRRELNTRLSRVQSALPEAAKAMYTVLYDAKDSTGERFDTYDLSALVKTASTLNRAVIDHLKNEDRLLEALDPALITGSSLPICGPEGDDDGEVA